MATICRNDRSDVWTVAVIVLSLHEEGLFRSMDNRAAQAAAQKQNEQE